jgi:hypothetical protein
MGVQVTGFDPAHVPPLQVYVCSHRSVPVQVVPSGSELHAVEDVAGVQISQAFAGFTVPDAKTVPPMQQVVAVVETPL